MFYRNIFNFRRKMLLVHVVLFLTIIFSIFPFVQQTVGQISHHFLEERARELVEKIDPAFDRLHVIEYLREKKALSFMRITLFDHDAKPIFDSQIPEVERLTEYRPEVMSALKYGRGIEEHYSEIFGQSLSYFAISFAAHGEEYVLCIGQPCSEIRAISREILVSFCIFSAVILLLYGFMIFTIIRRLSRPIEQIISAIRPYQEGKEEFIPRIEMGKEIQPKNEFGKLAQTFNALNERIQKQIGHLVEQQERTKEILESLGEGVVAIDIRGEVTFINRAACHMLGVTRDCVFNQQFDMIQARRQGLTAKCQELIERSQERFETMIETFRVETQKLYFDLIVTPLAQRGGLILVLQDKTSDYEVIEMGKDFIANASHELRTPITIIRGFAETLYEVPSLSIAQTKEISEKILKTSLRLDSLVKSLLTLADIENLSEERFQLANLAAIAENCKCNLQLSHPNVKIAFHAKVKDAPILSDSDLIEMAVMNLLENAIKYSPVPAEIDITVDSVAERVQVSVKDKGIGIPSADLPHVFERFYTVDKARSRRFGGTGLGLSIVKTIVQKHHGECLVVSELGQGSTFTIRLPAYQS